MTLLELFAGSGVRGPSAVALGTFDGVHLGHRRLIAELVREARRLGGKAVVVTFHPRPLEVLRPGAPSSYLGTLEQRIDLLHKGGADAIVPLAFTPELSQVSAEDFAGALVERLGMHTLVGGPDLAFGRNREGSGEQLRNIGRRLGFRVLEVPPIEASREAVRSSTIQRILAEGEVARAAALLGRPYGVQGVVVHGAGRGRQLGIPTANVAAPPNVVVPGNGIYAVRFHTSGQSLMGAASLGTNPTFGENPRTLEVHVLDFEGDLYGKIVEVEFIAYLRPEARFTSVDDLIRQMRDDVQICRELLGGA